MTLEDQKAVNLTINFATPIFDLLPTKIVPNFGRRNQEQRVETQN